MTNPNKVDAAEDVLDVTSSFFNMKFDKDSIHNISYNAFYEMCKENDIIDEDVSNTASSYLHHYDIYAIVHSGKVKDIKVTLHTDQYEPNANLTFNSDLISTLNKQIKVFKTMLPMFIKYTESYSEVPKFMIPIMKDVFRWNIE